MYKLKTTIKDFKNGDVVNICRKSTSTQPLFYNDYIITTGDK